MGILLILEQLKVRILLPWECVGWIFMRRHTSVSFSYRTLSSSSSLSSVSFLHWITFSSWSSSFCLWVFILNFVPVLAIVIGIGLQWRLFNLHRTSSATSFGSFLLLILVECEYQMCQRVWLQPYNGGQCQAFRGISFRDGRGRNLSKSRDPGIFGDGISLIFSSHDFLEIVWDFSGLTFFIQLVFTSKQQVL